MKYIILSILVFLNLSAFAAGNPVARISYTPASGYLPMTINFSAAGSTGNIVSYYWTFGDGASGEGRDISHFYSAKKVENIQLTVTDDQGRKDKAVMVYKFNSDNTAPQLTFDVPEQFDVLISTPLITAYYSDATSKVDLSKVRFLLDDLDVTSHAAISDNHAVLQFTSDWPLVPGQHYLTIRVSDYYGNATTKRLNIFYDSQLPAAHYLNGTVLDESGLPLAGAQVISTDGPVGSNLSGTTDLNGKFFLPFSVSGEYRLQISKTGYLPLFKTKSVIAGQDDVLPKVFLAKSDTKVTNISASSGGTATNSSGSISLVIPPGALPSNVSLSMTETKIGKALPIPLPNGSQFTYANTTATNIPVTFSQPAIMTIDNILGFPPGFEIAYGTTSNGMNIWVDSGHRAVVSEDGTKISFPISNIGFDDFPLGDVDTNDPSMDPDPEEDPIPPETDPANDTSDPSNPAEGEECSSRLSVCSNNLAIDYGLPTVKRRGRDFGFSLSYNSLAANPHNILSTRSSNLEQDNVPTNVLNTVQWAGMSDEKVYVGETGIKESAFYSSQVPKSKDGKLFGTGSFQYRTELASRFDNFVYAETPYFGGPPTAPTSVTTREPVYLQEYGYGRSVINNQRYSVFGAGWDLDGWERLILDPDGTVTFIDGRGAKRFYTPLSPQRGKPVVQKRLGQSTQNLSYHKGFIYGADCSGNQVFRIDTKGRMTTLAGGQFNLKSELNCPTSIAPSRKGGYYIADSGNGRILFIDKLGKSHVVANSEKNVGHPTFVTEDNVLAVHFIDGDEIKTISPYDGSVLSFVGNSSNSIFKYELKRPTQIHYDEYFNLIVTDQERGEIIKFYINNRTSRVISKDIKGVKALAFDPILNRYFALNSQGRVYHWDGLNTKRSHLLDLSDSTPKMMLPGNKNKAFEKVESISFSPEVGLITAGESGLKMLSIDNISKRFEVINYIPSIGDFSQLSKNSDGTFTRTLVDKTIIQYDSAGFITSRTSSDGSNISYIYSPSHRLLRVDVPVSGSYTLSYDGRGYVTSITDPAGRITQFLIDGNGDLSRITNPENESWNYSYNSSHLLIAKRDEIGQLTQYQYALSRLIGAIYPGNREKSINNTIVQALLSTKNLSEIPRISAGQVIASFVSPEGREKSYVLGSQGADIGMIDGEGSRNFVERDANSKPTTTTSSEGKKTIKQFDELGRETYVADQGGIKLMTYDPVSQKVNSSKDVWNFVENFEYNSFGMVSKHINKRGKATSFGYGSDGTLTSIMNPIGATINFEQDSLGNMISSTDSMGNKTTLTRDVAGNITSSRDPLGFVTNFAYSSKNQIQNVIDAKGGVISYEYTPRGLLSSLTDTKNNKTSFVYNEQDKISKIINPLNQEENFTYDLDGNLLSRTTKKGEMIHFTYNGNNKVLSRSFPGGTVSFSYDRDGNLTSVSDDDSVIKREYDNQGRLSVESSDHYNGYIEYKWDERGQNALTNFYLENKIVITIDRYIDQNHNVVKAIGFFNGKKVEYSKIFDDADRVTKLTYPSGAYSEIFYDKNSRIIEQDTNFFPNQKNYVLGYKYSANGNITSIIEHFGGSRTTRTFDFDELNRLVKEDSIFAKNYVLDPAGNNSGEGGQFNELHHLLQDSLYSYSYDLNGNLISKTHLITGDQSVYHWTPENQLLLVELYKGGVKIKSISFSYDGLGRRISRHVADHVNSSKSYMYKYVLDNDNIIAILDENDRLVSGFFFGESIDEPIAMVSDTDNNGEPEIYSYVKDNLNSVKLILDEKNAPVQFVNYSAYGETQILNIGQQSLKLPNIFYYTSREFEPETGDYFNRSRYYNPGTGRFLSEDSLGMFGEDKNLYRYVLNNPLKYTDPGGYQAAVGTIPGPIGIIIGGICVISSNGGERERLARIAQAKAACAQRRWERAQACAQKPAHVQESCLKAAELEELICMQNAEIQN